MNIEYNKKKTTIYDSYLMKNVSKEVKEIIKERKEKGYKTNRSLNSYIRETKAHNRLYKLGLFKNHTKNTDLEENIKLWKEITYFIIGI